MADAASGASATEAQVLGKSRPFSAFERMVAWRYLRSRRKEAFISVIAGFSFIGIMLGVATLIIVMLLRPEGLFPKRQRAAELHGDGEVAGEKHVALGSP